MIFVLIALITWVLFLAFVNILFNKAQKLLNGLIFDAEKEFSELIQKITTLQKENYNTGTPQQIVVNCWLAKFHTLSFIKKTSYLHTIA